MIHRPRLHFHAPHIVFPRPLQLPIALIAAVSGSLVLLGVLVNVRPLPVLGDSGLGPTTSEVSATVGTYVNEWRPVLDPLVTLDNGVQVKSSNVRGVEIGGVRYYYRLQNTFSYDPVSRGEAKEYQVVAVLDPGTQWEVEIYRLKP